MTDPGEVAATPAAPARPEGSAAILVAAGIFLSRIFGLVRQRVFAHYFGTSAAADAFNAALRIPNMLQNLFGEGVLSASFIPVYAGLRARGDDEEARRVAGAVGALLAVVVAVLVLVGVLAAPLIVDVIVPGFSGPKRDLTVRIVRILFPGIGVLVQAAWCLGILNSHRKFFLSYASPVLWNLAMIAGLLWFGGRRNQQGLAIALAWATVIGCVLQLLVQLPVVLKLVPGLRLQLRHRSEHVREVVRNFGPTFAGRGVVQISSFVDQFIASPLPDGAVSALTYAQNIYLLPVSLFGMSISAAELPSMSSLTGSTEELAAKLRARLDTALRRVAFFVVPSAVAMIVLGDEILGVLLRSGRFTGRDTQLTWAVLDGAALGLVATTLARVYSSTHYALRDTRSPLRFSAVRVGLGLVLSALLALWLPRQLGLGRVWGAAGITLASSLAGWVEYALLRRSMHRRIGRTAVPGGLLARLWGAAMLAGGAGYGAKLLLGPGAGNVMRGLIALGVFAAGYGGLTLALGVPEARSLAGRALARVRR